MPISILRQSARYCQMKIELKSRKRRDGFVCVDLNPPSETPHKERRWVKTLGEIAGLLAIFGLGWLAFAIF